MRPEDVDIASEGGAGRASVPATIDVVEPLGADTLVFASMVGHQMALRVRPEVRPQRGMSVRLNLDLERAHLFDATTGRRLSPAHP